MEEIQIKKRYRFRLKFRLVRLELRTEDGSIRKPGSARTLSITFKACDCLHARQRSLGLAKTLTSRRRASLEADGSELSEWFLREVYVEMIDDLPVVESGPIKRAVAALIPTLAS